MRNIIYFFLLFLSPFIYSDCPNQDALFASMQETLSKFTRPFTILDYNSQTPDLVFQIAREYPLATCILAGKDPEILTQFLSLCKEQKNLTNVVILGKPLTVADLKNLAQTEFFDITISHRNANVKSFLQIAKNFSELIITQDKNKESGEYTTLFTKGTESPKIKLHWFSEEKPSFAINLSDNGHSITIDDETNNVSHKVTRAPGISLISFLALQGSYPESSLLEKKISKIRWKFYRHVAPWDIYVSGEQIEILPLSLAPNRRENPKQFVLDILHNPSNIKTYLSDTE
jgi:hypothetical protein